MYKIIGSFNENTKLALKNNTVFVLKRISLEDVPVMKKLIQLENPYMVKLYDFCEIDGIFYVVEEYIQGVTLEEYVKSNFPLDDTTVNNIASSVCIALSAVHRVGVVHRDVNPNNIMIDKYGNVKLIDFGISRNISPDKRLDTHILGTQGYAAPEQYGFSQTNERADIYSLGVVMNYMLTLKMPNEEKAKGYFTPIIDKCTEIDESKRYSSADELLNDLKRRRRSNSILRTLPGFKPNTTKWQKAGAVIFYIIFFFVEFMTVVSEKSDIVAVYDAFTIFFMFGLPFLLVFNGFNYLDYLPFTRHKSKKVRIIFVIIFILISLSIATSLILLSAKK